MDYTELAALYASCHSSLAGQEDAIWISLSEDLPNLDAAIKALQYQSHRKHKLTYYQSFDPKVIIREIMKNHKAYMERSTLTSFNVKLSDETTFKYDNRQPLPKDVKLLITLYFFAGRVSNLKITADTRNLIDMIVVKLGIDTKARASGSSIRANVVTLPKIVICFPGVLVDLYHKGKAKYLVSLTDLGVDSQVSKSLLTPLVVSMIPHKMLTKPLLLVFLCHVLTDNVKKQVTKRTNLSKMLQYFKAYYSSQVMPEAIRVKYMIRYGLTDSDGFIASIRQSNSAAEQKLKDLRPNDKDLLAVINEIKEMQLSLD